MIVGCDIDGVLTDVKDFYHILPDWDEYYKHTLELPAIPEVVMLVNSLLLGGHKVVFITGRPLSTEQATKLWLRKNIPSLHHPDVRMRENMDFRPTVDIKLEVVRELKPSLMIEDEPKAVEAMTAEGFTVLQVHGYRLSYEDSVPYLGQSNT